MKWPQRIIDSLGRAPQVGDWFAECCIEDFQQITDPDHLQFLLEHYDDMDSGGRFWAAEQPARSILEAEAKHP
jgi:hypothetical protein